jgi:hypothetical protein
MRLSFPNRFKPQLLVPLCAAVLGGFILQGCTTGCIAAHGMPGDEDGFRDVRLDDGSWEIILPYTDLVKCTQNSVPTGPIAGNRARALCPSGFEVLVEGMRRPSDGHTNEELVWRVRCAQG